MSDGLEHCGAVIIVFAMEGCPYCDDYQPKLDYEIKRFKQAGAPIFYYRGGVIPPHTIPVLVLDGASDDPQISALADQHQVTGMPTTLLLRRYDRPIKLEGDQDDRQIYDLLVAACHANT